MECKRIIKIEDREYIADTDFRTAIKCNMIALDDTIGDFERTLGIIYTIFGEKGLENAQDYELLINWIKDYLSCGKEIENNDKEPDMDYVEDMDYIIASFQSDYNINLDEVKMDWKRFNVLINGLSNSEFGNCCVLNRIRNLRNTDISQIKDKKERDKVIEAKKSVELKKNKKENNLTNEQLKSLEELEKLIKA